MSLATALSLSDDASFEPDGIGNSTFFVDLDELLKKTIILFSEMDPWSHVELRLIYLLLLALGLLFRQRFRRFSNSILAL